MGYPEAEYAANKVINALSAGSSPSGILSPMPTGLKISTANNQLTVTISGNRSCKVDGSVIAFTSMVRFAVNDNNQPENFDDYTEAIDFDLERELSDNYSVTKSINFDKSSAYYRVFAKSSSGVINAIKQADIPVTGTIITDSYTSSSRYMLVYPTASYNYVGSDISEEDYKKITYAYDDSVISSMKLANKEGTFTPFDSSHTDSNWLDWTWFKKCKPFVVDSKGYAVEQLNPDNLMETIDGDPSIVSKKEEWDNYQGVYTWIPRIYFQSENNGYSSYSNYIQDPCTFRSYSYPLTGDTSSMGIVCSEQSMPQSVGTNDSFLGSTKIPFVPYPSVSDNFSYDNSDTAGANSISPGFYDTNSNLYLGVWVPCFYADENGKSWPGNPHTITSVSEINDLMSAYPSSGKVRLFGGTIWETLNMMLIMLSKSFDVIGTYGLGFSESEVSGEQPTQTTSIPANSGFSFKSSGWNKIFNSYVLGSSPYFILDPYIKIMDPNTNQGGLFDFEQYCIFESVVYNSDTPTVGGGTQNPEIDKKYTGIYGKQYGSSSGTYKTNEITYYYRRPTHSCEPECINYSQGNVINRIVSFSGSGSYETSKDSHSSGYSHQSLRGILGYRTGYNDDSQPGSSGLVYNKFAFRRAPYAHKDLGLTEFLSLYTPLKTNTDTYISNNQVAYATMVFPPDTNYAPVIKED